MNIPDSVKIGGHIIDVEITTDSDKVNFDEIGKTCVGKNSIFINANYPKSRQEECLLHEMIHNCLFDLQEEQDEAMVERLGVMFYAIIVDNPEIFEKEED